MGVSKAEFWHPTTTVIKSMTMKLNLTFIALTPRNPPQMRILKRIEIFQAVAEKLRRSGMIIDMVSMFYQPRRGVIGLAHIMPSFQDLGTG